MRMLVFMYSTLYSCQFVMKLEFQRQIFVKYSNIKFDDNPSIGSRVLPCGWTEGQTDKTELIAPFRNLAISPKNQSASQLV
jgi:hypothetical protein